MVAGNVRGKNSKTALLTLFIGGRRCASCVSNVEGAIKQVPGVKNVVVNLATGKASVEYDLAQASLVYMKRIVEDVGAILPQPPCHRYALCFLGSQRATDSERPARRRTLWSNWLPVVPA